MCVNVYVSNLYPSNKYVCVNVYVLMYVSMLVNVHPCMEHSPSHTSITVTLACEIKEHLKEFSNEEKLMLWCGREALPSIPLTVGVAPRSRACRDIRGIIMLTPNRSWNVRQNTLLTVI